MGTDGPTIDAEGAGRGEETVRGGWRLGSRRWGEGCSFGGRVEEV